MTSFPTTEASISGLRSVPVTYFDVSGNEAFLNKFSYVFDPLNNQERFFTKAQNGENCFRYTQVSEKYPTIDFVLFIAFLVARDYGNILDARKDLAAFITKLQELYNDIEIHSGIAERHDRIEKILYSLAKAAYSQIT